uniref:Uncharacterized protein n=1 Tax=Lotharella globosa TaxID=91324 RepID=A0A7S3YGA9_9EUKA
MGCSSSELDPEQAKKRRCAELTDKLVGELCSFDRLQKVGNDMKQFALGTRILSNLLLGDIWNLYASRKSMMSLNEFSQIAGCYFQSLVRALPSWVENSAAHMLEMMHLNIPSPQVGDFLRRCKPRLMGETKLLCIGINRSMEELVIIAWDGIAKGHAVIDWQLFSTKFLSAMEKAWGKKLFWRKLCLILYKQMYFLQPLLVAHLRNTLINAITTITVAALPKLHWFLISCIIGHRASQKPATSFSQDRHGLRAAASGLRKCSDRQDLG